MNIPYTVGTLLGDKTCSRIDKSHGAMVSTSNKLWNGDIALACQADSWNVTMLQQETLSFLQLSLIYVLLPQMLSSTRDQNDMEAE